MKIRTFNSWCDKDCFGCMLLPSVEFGREPASWGYPRVIYIGVFWLFWSVQFTFGKGEKRH